MHKYVEDEPVLIINKAITNLQLAMNEKLEPGDERRIVTENIASMVAALKADINVTASKKYLENMEGEEVDLYGNQRGVFRLAAQKSLVPVVFSLPTIRSVDSLIPKGTRITAGGKHYFEALKEIVIPKGSNSITVTLACTEVGEDSNGYPIGSIKTITDSLPFACTVANTGISAGGSMAESDADYKGRIIKAPSAMTTAGSEEAYEYHTKSADVNIESVKILSPSPCVIHIVPLYSGGRGPTAEERAHLLTRLTDKRIKPLSDQIVIVAPQVVNYNINLTYYIAKAEEQRESVLKAEIESSREEFVKWQDSELDLNINPDQLRFMMMRKGAFKVDITEPTYQVLSGGKYAKCNQVTLNYGGVL